MEAENLKLWGEWARPPEDALKTIRGGRLNGMTDISPVWRYEALTRALGPCGVGWAYDIVRLWTEDAPDGQRIAFAQINLRLRAGETWTENIPGIGGSMMLAKQSGGMHVSDEAFKMAVTDALSVACKMLGIGADIYRGLFDGSKYRDATPAAGKPVARKPENAPPDNAPVDAKWLDRLATLAAKHCVTGPELTEYLSAKFGRADMRELTRAQATQLADWMKTSVKMGGK
jgi:hypothetical protein